MIKDENLSLEDKQKLAQNFIERYLRENGYEGEIPEVLLTDEAHSFTVDSKDKETGAKRREKIYFSINDIANPDLAFSKLFAHEKAHMNTYDEGKDGEETAIHTRGKVGSENKNKVFTEEEKADYQNNLRNKYKDQKSIEQQFAEAKLVPEKDKEHILDVVFDFFTSSELAGEDYTRLEDKEQLKKYGDRIYYNGYRVVSISEDGWAKLDFNDTLPDENEIVLIAGISRLILHPIRTISNIKKEVKLLTNNGKEVIEEATENDLKKLVDDTPTIRLIDNTTNGNTGNSLKNFNLDDLKKLKHNVHATEKHIKGTTYYNQEVAKGVEKSYFYSNVGTGDIEKIFIDAIDNGEIVEAKGGGIRIFIDTGKPVGMVLDDGVWKSTTKIQFHAGKKGFHGVPYIGEKGVKK